MSLDASHANVSEVAAAADVVSPGGADGRVASQALVAAVRLARAETFPAASNASTANVYDVPHVSPPNVYCSAVVVAAFVDER